MSQDNFPHFSLKIPLSYQRQVFTLGHVLNYRNGTKNPLGILNNCIQLVILGNTVNDLHLSEPMHE
jgi:hypothetical protein